MLIIEGKNEIIRLKDKKNSDYKIGDEIEIGTKKSTIVRMYDTKSGYMKTNNEDGGE